MELPIIIGKESNNEIHQVDLINLPHLFVSYSETEHIKEFFADAMNSLIQPAGLKKLQFACALSREMYTGVSYFLQDVKLLSLFIRNEVTEPVGGSKYLFMRTLMKELKRRQKIKQTNGKHKPRKSDPLIVMIDDVFDIIITKRKYTGSYFLEMLAAGKELEIHFIVASVWAYRNLMKQLIICRVETKRSAGKPVPEKSQITIQPLIAELIITPEHLYFFKESGQTDYTRYFPGRE